MKEYELVREIENQCANNQMRDIFFDEVETDDPVAYVRQLLKDREVELTVDYPSMSSPTRQELRKTFFLLKSNRKTDSL